MVARKKKLFMSGNSQTKKLPYELQVWTWQSRTDSLTMFRDDIMGDGRQQSQFRKRTQLLATR